MKQNKGYAPIRENLRVGKIFKKIKFSQKLQEIN